MPSKKQHKMNAWQDYISHKWMIPKSWMPTWTVRRSTWIRIGSNKFLSMEPSNSILPRDMNMHIQWTSRTVGKPPVTISTMYHKYSPFSVEFLPSKSDSSISKPPPSIGRPALPHTQSSLPVVIWPPPWAPSHMQSTNSLNPKTAVMECIVTHWSKSSEHYLTICKLQCTTQQYPAAHRSVSSISVITTHKYRMNDCTQCSSVFTMVLRFKLMV
jgi:hypothetical protein